MREVIYFIACDLEPWIKIGYADCLRRRLSELQCGTPRSLSVLAALPGPPVLERQIHKALTPVPRIREWFALNPITRELIERVNDGRATADNVCDLAKALCLFRRANRDAAHYDMLVRNMQGQQADLSLDPSIRSFHVEILPRYQRLADQARELAAHARGMVA